MLHEGDASREIPYQGRNIFSIKVPESSICANHFTRLHTVKLYQGKEREVMSSRNPSDEDVGDAPLYRMSCLHIVRTHIAGLSMRRGMALSSERVACDYPDGSRDFHSDRTCTAQLRVGEKGRSAGS